MRKVWYAHTSFGDEEKKAVMDALESDWLTAGPKVVEFEERLAKIFETPHAVMVNSGSSANLLALASLNLPKGSPVFTPALTFSTTLAPIIQLGLRPVLVDCELGSYGIDMDLLERAVKRETRFWKRNKKGALMLPHLLGNIYDLSRAQSIAAKYGLEFISDSCDTIGSRFMGEGIGAWAPITTTSFYASHIITAMGGGGAVMLHSAELADRIRRMRDWGRGIDDSEDVDKRYAHRLGGIPYDAKFVYTEMGYNMKPLDAQGAFGLAQLNRLPQFAAKRRENFEKMRLFFSDYSGILILPKSNPLAISNWLAFPILLRNNAYFTREELARHFEQNGIQTRPIFSGNITYQPAFRPILGEQEFPNATRVMRDGLVLGCHQGMTDEDLDYIFETFKKIADVLVK